MRKRLGKLATKRESDKEDAFVGGQRDNNEEDEKVLDESKESRRDCSHLRGLINTCAMSIKRILL